MRDASLTPRQLWRIVVALLVLTAVAVSAALVALEQMTVERAGWVAGIIVVSALLLVSLGSALPNDHGGGEDNEER